MATTIPILLTHSGKFHCDDALAYATLRLALGLSAVGHDHRLVRTRDKVKVAAADIVFDVGGVHDDATSRFDHHQRGAPVRADDGVPFSAAGLVWQVHGIAAVRALLAPEKADAAAAVAKIIDDTLIRRVDMLDNGVGEPGNALELSSLVEDFNGTWDADRDSAAEDAAFIAAADMVHGVLKRRVARVHARLAADAIVLEAHSRSADPRILELERSMPWQEPVFSHGLEVLYAVYPVPGGNWMIGAMPPERHSFAQRLPLPAGWAGLQDEALVAASGIEDAVFVHAKRFVASARSRVGAMAMAMAAIQSSLREQEPTDDTPAESSGSKASEATHQAVSLIITRDQRAVLRERGYSDEAIRTMTTCRSAHAPGSSSFDLGRASSSRPTRLALR